MSDTKRELFDKLRYEIHMADMLATEMNHSRGMSMELVSAIERKTAAANALANTLRDAMVKRVPETVVAVPATAG